MVAEKQDRDRAEGRKTNNRHDTWLVGEGKGVGVMGGSLISNHRKLEMLVRPIFKEMDRKIAADRAKCSHGSACAVHISNARIRDIIDALSALENETA